jgi:hypothetical protein
MFQSMLTFNHINVATLMSYYSFDLPNQLSDSGPNGLDGVQNNAALVTGRINQALRFTGSISYFQAYGFYNLAWGVVANKPLQLHCGLIHHQSAVQQLCKYHPFRIVLWVQHIS